MRDRDGPDVRQPLAADGSVGPQGDGLDVDLGARAGRGVATVADGDVPLERFQLGLGEHPRDQPHALVVSQLVSVADGETHYLPRCLRDYAVCIALPATSKRPGMTYSNNVKLFVGAVPRHMYQLDEPSTTRPRIHVDLHRSVANIYRAVIDYAPFQFYVNGGRAMVEGRGEIELDQVFVGDDAVELDLALLARLGLEAPGYIERLAPEKGTGNGLA